MHTQRIPDSLLSYIHQLNRAYLHTARDLLHCAPVPLVEALFGVDDTLSRWLVQATPEAIERLATTPGTVFAPRLPAASETLLAACSRVPEHDVTAMHLLLRHLGAPPAADQEGGA